MISPSDFRVWMRDQSVRYLSQVPLEVWAGDLPATGDGVRYAFGVPRHLWAIGHDLEPHGWEVEPLLRQLAADLVRGSMEVGGVTVPLRALLDSVETLRLTRRIERAGHSATPVDAAAKCVFKCEVACYDRLPDGLSTLEARAIMAKAQANAGLTYDEAMNLTLSEVAAHRRE